MRSITRLNSRDEGRPRRRRRLRTIQTLPSLLTVGNLVCGIAAIHFCMSAVLDPGMGPMFLRKETLSSELVESFLPTFISISGFMIFAGMLFDMIDGRLARFAHRTSNFGGQLDSLADMVTFGVAPAVLMITLLTRLPEADLASMPGRAIWVVAAIYTSCTALRLARFNVEHADDAGSHLSFRGLPSPAAAAVVASLVILQQMAVTQKIGNSVGLPKILANTLPYVVLACALLMVSNFPYVHLANRYLRRRRPFSQFVIFLIALGVFLWHPAQVLTGFVCAYAASGPIQAIIRWFRGDRRPGRPAATDADSDTEAPRPEARSG